MRLLGLFVAVSVAAAVAGCRTVDIQSDPFSTDRRSATRAHYAIDWWLPLVAPQLLEVAPREEGSPAVDGDTQRIVTLTRDGQVRSLHPEGRVEWSFATGHRFYGSATVHEGVVYVPGGDATLYALQATTGKELWRYEAADALVTAPVVAGDRVLVQARNEILYAVDAKTGKWVWQYRRDVPTGFSIAGASRPLVTFGTAYVGFADGSIVAIKVEDGTVTWQRGLSSEGTQFLDVDTAPVIDDAGRLYAASYKDGVFALDPETGATTWHAKLSGVTSLLTRGDVVFASGDNQVAALHAENGRTLWTFALRGRAAGRPTIVGNKLIVPADDSMLFLDPATGRALLEWDPGQGVSAAPSALGSRIYVLSNNGYLYAMQVSGSQG